jgi:hypothetical protein
MAELVAEHAETAGGIAEAPGGFGGRELAGEESTQGLVLAVQRLLWGEEEGAGLGIR